MGPRGAADAQVRPGDGHAHMPDAGLAHCGTFGQGGQSMSCGTEWQIERAFPGFSELRKLAVAARGSDQGNSSWQTFCM